MLEGMPLDRGKIRELRVSKGWSHAEAARHAGMANRQQWEAIESGRRADPSFSTVQRIARALGVTLDELAADDEAAS
jgi:transcriptional regulator with XRE-family HTH domain